MQNPTSILKRFKYFWKRSQFPAKEPVRISTIDKLVIFLVCIVISIISSYKILIAPTLGVSDVFSWGINFTEVLLTCGFLILVSRKENPNINSRQILLIISLLLVVQMIKNIFKNWIIDKQNSFMIGDKISDKLAAKKSNIKFLYRSRHNFYKQISRII